MANVSVLCDEAAWPLATGSVDRLILLHGLETSERPADVLGESARVLAPGGRVLFIVPARAGLWARRDGTPFGYGRPYSAAQLEAQLRRHGFTPERTLSALFAPPSQSPFWLRTADSWERIGRRFSRLLRGGVLLTEATKQVWAPRPGGHAARVRRALPILSPAPAALPVPRLP
jgi:SAM-dependent methyltransferase